jgi:hypothetical protein
MEQKKLSWAARLFLIAAVLISTGIFTGAALAKSYPEEWILGDRLLAGALFFIAFGWITGAYALLFVHTSPLRKRIFLYPLFKVMGIDGQKKSLIKKE